MYLPCFFQSFVFFGSVDFRLLLQRDITLWFAVISVRARELKTQLSGLATGSPFLSRMVPCSNSHSAYVSPCARFSAPMPTWKSRARICRIWQVPNPDLVRLGQWKKTSSSVRDSRRTMAVPESFSPEQTERFFLSVFSVSKDGAGFLHEHASRSIDASMPDSIGTGGVICGQGSEAKA